MTEAANHPRLDLDMAKRAAAAVDEIVDRNDAKQLQEIRSRARELPVMLRTSGVAATVAFYAAQAKPRSPGPAYRTVLGHLVGVAAPGASAAQPVAVVNAIAGLDAQTLARRTRELEVFAHWLKRLVEAHDSSVRAAQAAAQGPGNGPTTGLADA